MKRKILTAIAACVCALCCAIGTVACGNNSSGNSHKTKAGVDDFVRVIDGVFTSAGYTKSASSAKTSASDSAAGLGDELSELYTALKTSGNTSSVGSNLNYIKCDTLYQGANLAGMFKSMAITIGNDVFNNTYDLSKLDMQGYSAKIKYDDYYTLYGAARNGSNVVSAIRIDFKEYATGKFIFKLVQYDKMNSDAELRISCYDSDSAAFTATLKADLSVDYTSYDNNYSAFTVSQCRLVVYGNDQYVSSSTDSEKIMKFAKNKLGFGNKTYASLVAVDSGKSLTDKQVAGVYSEMTKNYYVNPYKEMNGDKDDNKGDNDNDNKEDKYDKDDNKDNNDNNGDDDNKPDDNKPDDNKPDDNKPDDNKPDDNRPDDNKPDDNRPDDNKPDDNKPDDNEITEVETLELSLEEVTLHNGETEQLSNCLLIYPEEAADRVEWSSSNMSIAYVEADGRLTARNAGTATVTAAVGDKSATLTVNVTGFTFSVNGAGVYSVDGVVFTEEEAEKGILDIPYTVPWNDKPVGRVAANAFAGDDRFYTVYLPVTLKEVGRSAFRGCPNLENVCTYKVDGVELDDYYQQLAVGAEAFYACPNLVEFSDGFWSVCSIGDMAFYGCKSLAIVNELERVTAIGESAFEGCTKIETLYLYCDLVSIGNSAFKGCTSLSELKVYSDSKGDYMLKTIGEKAFYGCTSLEEFVVPFSLETIGEKAFENCTSLSTVDIDIVGYGIDNPYGAYYRLKNVGKYAFSGCSELTAIAIPNSWKVIADYTFYDCTKLASVTFEGGATSIGRCSFQYCVALKSITLPDTVTFIGSGAFSQKGGADRTKGLTQIVIPESVTEIESSVFGYCALAEIVYLGTAEQWNGITKAGYWALQTLDELVIQCADNKTLDKNGEEITE